MSWRAGFCVTYRSISLRFAFAFSGGLWWAVDDLCMLFGITESPRVILVDLEPDDKAELQPYHTQVVNSAALRPWVQLDELEQFHAWIRDWLFPTFGDAFSASTRDAAEAMAMLHRKGITAWALEDYDLPS